MRNTTRLGLTLLFGAGAVLAIACGSDSNNPQTGTAGTGGTPGGNTSGGQGGSAAGATAGGGAAGTFVTGGGGTSGGEIAGAGGTGGAAAGMGGTGGTAAGTAGTGGTPEPIIPTVWYIDNFRLQRKAPGGEGGAGGAGGAGSDSAGAGSIADAAGAGGVGGAGDGPDPSFWLTFDANITPMMKSLAGFSPGLGGTAGPAIFDDTTFVWDANAGKTGGGAKASVPFTVAYQQADVIYAFPGPTNLTGYELVADVQLKDTGKIGDCPAVFLYGWSNTVAAGTPGYPDGAPPGYGNAKSAEPAFEMTQKLTKGQWTTLRFDFDGPYGYHSTSSFATYKPISVSQVGIQFVTFGCPK